MALLVYIVGKKGSGKTKLIEELLEEMRGRGIKVSTIKHAPKGFDFEKDKDTDRHMRAGSLFTALISDEGGFIEWRGRKEPEEIGRLLDESEIILVEGYKSKKGFKIEVTRDGEIVSGDMDAIVTDLEMDIPVPVFKRGDIKGIADFIISRREDVSLYVDGEKIPLNPFVRSFIKGVVRGMVKNLKRVGDMREIKIMIRGGDDSRR